MKLTPEQERRFNCKTCKDMRKIYKYNKDKKTIDVSDCPDCIPKNLQADQIEIPTK